MTIQFQAIEHTDKLAALSTKDWIYKLCHQFPIANIVNANTVLTLESIAKCDTNDMRRAQLDTLIKELAEKFITAKSDYERKNTQRSNDNIVEVEQNSPAQKIQMLW